MKDCIKCGNKLNDNDKFCNKCRYKIKKISIKTKKTIIVSIITIVLILIIIPINIVLIKIVIHNKLSLLTFNFKKYLL